MKTDSKQKLSQGSAANLGIEAAAGLVREFAATLATAGSDISESIRQAKQKHGDHPLYGPITKLGLSLNYHAEIMEAAAEKASRSVIREDSQPAEMAALIAAQQAIIMAQRGIIENRKRRLRRLGFARVRYLLEFKAMLAASSLIRKLLTYRQGCHYGKQ